MVGCIQLLAKCKRVRKIPQVKKRSSCPAACALDIAGDKWTLLVVRDLLRGRHTYGELAAADEGIPTNILADRLKKMARAGLLASKPYQDKPVRYRYDLTAKGEDLGSVLTAMARWGRKHVKGTRVAPEFRKS
jgi:DNA-binding HxlR family transcriptional regulator